MVAAAGRNIVSHCPLRGCRRHYVAFVARAACTSSAAPTAHSSASASPSHPSSQRQWVDSRPGFVRRATTTNNEKQHSSTNGSSSSSTNTFLMHNTLTSPTQILSSPSPSSSVTSTAEQRIQKLLTHPAMTWNSTTTFASMHKKKKSGMRHLKLFDNGQPATAAESDPQSTTTTTRQDDDYLFNEFASAICHANVIPRKEIFETWSAALHIYYSFFGDAAAIKMMKNNNDNRNVAPIRRVVDIAAGHGLLAWALLLLDEEYQRKATPLPPLTAFCLDVQMPPSATLIHCSMIQHFAHLESRFQYVEGRLEQLVPHPSCLLASVHGCGILTDMLVATAAEHKMPLAVVPCCHSRKPIVLEVASRYAKVDYEDILVGSGDACIPNLSDRLDGVRITALRNAGLEAKEAYLPKMFTDTNRLIMGLLSTTNTTEYNSQEDYPAAAASSISTLGINEPTVTTTFITRVRNNMPPLNNHHSVAAGTLQPKPRYMKGLCIPCHDSLSQRQLITQLSGKTVMHNRNHSRFPRLDVSLWLPADGKDKTDGTVSKKSLSFLVNEVNHGIECTRKAQTFRRMM